MQFYSYVRYCFSTVVLSVVCVFALPSFALAAPPSIFRSAPLQLFTEGSQQDTSLETPADPGSEPTTAEEPLDEGTPPSAQDIPTGETILSPVDPDSGLSAPLLEDDGTAMLFLVALPRAYQEHYNWGDDGRIGRQGWGWFERPAAGAPWYTFQVGGSKEGIKLAPTGGGKTYVNKEVPPVIKDPNAPGALVIYNVPGTVRIQEATFRDRTLFSDSHCQGLRVAMYGRDKMNNEVKDARDLNPDGLKIGSTETLVNVKREINTAQVWFWTQPCARGPVIIPTPNKSFGQVKRVDLKLTDIDLPQLRISDNLRDLKTVWLNKTGTIPGLVRAIDPGSGIQKITRVLNGASRRIVLPRHSVACDEFHRAQTESPATCPFDRTFPTTVPLAATQDGVNELVLTAYDRSGHQSPPTKIQLNIDRKAPSARFTAQTIQDLSGGWHGGKGENIRTELELKDEDSGIQSVRLLSQIRGKKAVLAEREFCTKRLKTASCPHESQPTFTLKTDDLIDGEHQLAIEVTDSAGNTHRSTPLRYQHDHTPPNPPASITASLKNRTNAHLSWPQARDPLPGSGIDHYRYRLTNHSWQETKTRSQTFENLVPGQSYVFDLQAVDRVGNVSEVTRKEWLMVPAMRGRRFPFADGNKCTKNPQPKDCKSRPKPSILSTVLCSYHSAQLSLDALAYHNAAKTYRRKAKDWWKVTQQVLQPSENLKFRAQDYRYAPRENRRGTSVAYRRAHKAFMDKYNKHLDAQGAYKKARADFAYAKKLYKAERKQFGSRKTRRDCQRRYRILGDAVQVAREKARDYANKQVDDINKNIEPKRKEYRDKAADNKNTFEANKRQAYTDRQLGILSTVDDAVVRKYQPVLMLSKKERFWPVSLDYVIPRFLRDGDGHKLSCLTFSGIENSCIADITQLSDLERFTTSESAPNYFIDYPASSSSVSRQEQMELNATGGKYRQPMVYFFRGYGKKNDGQRAMSTSVQYWWYYTYNYMKTGAGFFGRHEGDFEHVALIFSLRSGELRYVFTARHDANESKRQSTPLVYSGKQIYTVTGKRQCNSDVKGALCFEGDHPVIYAALGSHASYPWCGKFDRRDGVYVPDDHTCVGGVHRLGTAVPTRNILNTTWKCWRGKFGEPGPVSSPVDSTGPDSPVWQFSKYYFLSGQNPCNSYGYVPPSPNRLTMRRDIRSNLKPVGEREAVKALSGDIAPDPSEPEFEHEILDEAELPPEQIDQMQQTGTEYDDQIDDCSDWKDPAQGGVRVVACDQQQLDHYVASGLEDPGSEQLQFIERDGQSASDANSVPAVFDSPDPTAANGLRLKIGQSSHPNVYVSTVHDGKVAEASFPNISSGGTGLFTLDTADPQQWVIKNDTGGIVATAVPQLVDGGMHDENSSPAEGEDNPQSDIKKSKITSLKVLSSNRLLKVNWSFNPPQEDVVFEVRGYKRAAKNVKFVVLKRIKGNIHTVDYYARTRLKIIKSLKSKFIQIVALDSDGKLVSTSRFARIK